MQIIREVPLVTAEESDECTVTLTVPTGVADLTAAEAWALAAALRELGSQAYDHGREEQEAVVARVAGQPVYGFDIEQEDA